MLASLLVGLLSVIATCLEVRCPHSSGHDFTFVRLEGGSEGTALEITDLAHAWIDSDFRLLLSLATASHLDKWCSDSVLLKSLTARIWTIEDGDMMGASR